MPLIHESTKVYGLAPLCAHVELCKVVAAGVCFSQEGDVGGDAARAILRPVAADQSIYFLLTSAEAAPTEVALTEAAFCSTALPPGGIICTGDQLVMTWDNGPYGWKRVDKLVPGVDDLMMCNEHAFDSDVVDTDTGTRPGWVRRVLVQAIKLSAVTGAFYEIGNPAGGVMWGAEIGPDDDSPRPNTYVASGFILHNGVGRIFDPPDFD